jgi:hypothetical protein
MTEEDEEFNRIEREAAMRKEAVVSAISKEQKEYERGFVDGMQEQMKRSVDKAVNAMTRRTWLDMTTREQIARHVEQMGMNGYGTLAIAAAIRSMDLNAEEREWVGLTDDEVVRLKMVGRDLEFVSMTALRRFAKDIDVALKEKNHG